ncbi:MAG TPA: hypothetical protein VM734_15255 [Kofleriaceae bacterium]|nr:hypothetical protein [Kofleriaceae bacterium]
MSIDRRRTPRVPTVLAATWRRGPRRVPVSIVELNVHGAALRSAESPDLNYLMEIALTIEGRALPILFVPRSVRFLEAGAVDARYAAGVSIFSLSKEAADAWLALYRDARGPALSIFAAGLPAT